MNKEFTLTTHIVVSLAVAVFTWILIVKPLITIGPGKSLNYVIFTTMVLCILIPAIILISETYRDSITGEITDSDFFVLIKFISIALTTLVIQCFVIYYFFYPKKLSFNFLTIVMTMLFLANIGEACYTQYKLWVDDVKPNKIIDLLNVVVGILLFVAVIIKYFRQKSITIHRNKQYIGLKSNFDIWWILAYTVWNLLFRSRLGESTIMVFFLFVSLIVPLGAHITNTGDWVQVRLICLLVYLIMILGFTEGQGRIFPVYNIQGYDKIEDEKSIITKIQKEDWYTYSLVIPGLIFSTISVYTVSKKT